EASPANRARQAEVVQNFGVVVGNSPGENLPLPRICWRFKTLQLLQDFQRTVLSQNLRAWREMLPTQQPAHELSRRQRLHLATQCSESMPVDTCQQTPIAPFGFIAASELPS